MSPSPSPPRKRHKPAHMDSDPHSASGSQTEGPQNLHQSLQPLASTTSDPTTHSLLPSTNTPPTTFPLFPRLPPHLRFRIFILASPPPRTHYLEIYAYSSHRPSAQIRYIPPLPALFHTTSESRNAIMQAQGGELINLLTPPEYTPFYFNFGHDIVFLSSRFCSNAAAAAGTTPSFVRTTETFRLRELNSLLPARYGARLRRVVVTYSGLDEYSRIGGILRWYKGLEVLYVAMMDWWCERSVRTGLRRGVPGIGEVEERIGRALKEDEAEETEDEEESDEEKMVRLDVRERRRVVEVELRLDE